MWGCFGFALVLYGYFVTALIFCKECELPKSMPILCLKNGNVIFIKSVILAQKIKAFI